MLGNKPTSDGDAQGTASTTPKINMGRDVLPATEREPAGFYPFGVLPLSEEVTNGLKQPLVALGGITLITISCFAFALRTLNLEPWLSEDLEAVEVITQVTFIAEYLLRWYSKNLRPGYLLEWEMLLDFVAFSPLLLQSVIRMVQSMDGDLGWLDVSGYAFLRLLRILRFNRYLRDRETFQDTFGMLGGMKPVPKMTKALFDRYANEGKGGEAALDVVGFTEITNELGCVLAADDVIATFNSLTIAAAEEDLMSKRDSSTVIKFEVLADWWLTTGIGLVSTGGVKSYQLELARTINVLGTLLFVSSGLMYNAEHLVNPDFPNFFVALYFGLTTLTTVGFGDITPVTTTGRGIVSISILIGIALIPLQLSKLGETLIDEFKEDKVIAKDDKTTPTPTTTTTTTTSSAHAVAAVAAAQSSSGDGGDGNGGGGGVGTVVSTAGSTTSIQFLPPQRADVSSDEYSSSSSSGEGGGGGRGTMSLLASKQLLLGAGIDDVIGVAAYFEVLRVASDLSMRGLTLSDDVIDASRIRCKLSQEQAWQVRDTLEQEELRKHSTQKQ